MADLESGRPVPQGGYFQMGSNTKTFVAMMVLQLAEQRRLSLDDTVDRWLPGVVRGNGNDGTRITLRQLLQHASGLYDYANDLPVLTSAEGYHRHWNDDTPPERLVAIAMRHKPGDGSWSYSNTNYVVLGLIIKKATGRDWSTEVTDRILRPLRLRHTFRTPAEGIPAASARQRLRAVHRGRATDRYHQAQLQLGRSSG
ncbi:serine hydrolase domain-containing protein [Streptomyces sp. NPDC093149]|uniref:serine hydrolase domain-containing protein n=1 Tax=Streptomyces sp. NPDC093149 TaxID=3366031 RepID=UPI003808D9D3